MKRLILLILIPLICTFAAEAAAPAIVIQSESVSIHVKRDGCVERNVSLTMKLNTFQALRTVGEWFYSYNPKLEQVKILKSVTIHRDGSRFPAPENAILDQTPYSVENAPDFSGIREKFVSHTGLEPGCTVEFEYKTSDLIPHRFGVMEKMAGPWPIRRKTVTVRLDKKAEIIVNGGVKKIKDGTYEVKNTRSMRPAWTDSNANDLPYLYIRLANPVKQLKTRMANRDTSMETVINILKLNKNSTEMEVETALNRLLNSRLVTIHLKPELTGWGIRSFAEIVRSGYATPLEKMMLSHAVLKRYGIPHSAVLLADEKNGTVIATGAEFQLNAGLCNLTATNPWKSPFLLYGHNWVKPNQSAVSVLVKLTEQKDGSFTGTITAQREQNGADFSLSSLNPLKDASVTGETILAKTEDKLTKRGKLKLKLQNNQIRLNTVLDRVFHLPEIEYAVLNATSIRIPVSCTGIIHLSIEFAEKPKLVLPAGLKAVNRFGTSSTIWNLNGKTLTLDRELRLSAFKTGRNGFGKINELLTPVLNQSASCAFVE
ncbi:MAG: DUF3857 domain-containing protein [Acidobacteria bacterium]|nr:DUF3857 domain-containing protein [Acidobacteriota bacterium]